MRNCLPIIFLSMLIILSGCRSMKPNYSLFPSDTERRLNSLWRQGHGFNNPNTDKIRNNQATVDFDGRSSDINSAAKDIGGRALGNVLVYSIFEGVPAVFRGLTERIRNR